MKTQFKSVIEILEYYKDEKRCVRLLELQRWGGKPTCPHCGHERVYRTNVGFKCASNKCYKKFTVTVGTIYHGTKIKLRYWFAAIYLITAHKKGISSHQLARDLGVCQKTAWFMNHRIRQMLVDTTPAMFTDQVQADETYVGGKTKNMHKWKREIVYAAGSAAVHHNPVLGMYSDGKVIAVPIPTPHGTVVKPILLEHIALGSTLVTDGHGSFAGSRKFFNHEVTDHESGEFVNKRGFHTNNIENYWSVLKRGIVGIYHHVSGKHLDRYLSEFSYRYNSRKIKDADRFIGVLKNCGTPLPYKVLIDKQ